MLLLTAFVQINIAFSLCTDTFTENKPTRNLHTSCHPVKTAHNKQNTQKMTKIIWKCIIWILTGVQIGAKMLLENVGKQRKHKTTPIPKKILYKNGILIFLMSPVQKAV